MNRIMTINLPVKDVAAASKFYADLGFELDGQFSNDQSALLIFNDGCTLMLVAEDFFMQNTGREVVDTRKDSEVSLAIQVADRAEVDRLISVGIAGGGKQIGEVTEEEEINLYSRSLIDLDGHKLDFLCMQA